jgi:hypothetical protein
MLITLVQPYHCYYNMHIIIFLHLLSTNHKCVLILVISPCYSKPTSQKMEMVWNSLTWSSRHALPRLHIPMDYGAFCYFCCRESRLVFVKTIVV